MTSRASSSSRLENQRLREQIERDKARKKDKFGSLAELDRKLDPESLPPDIIVSYSSFSRMFLSVSKDGKPDIDYCLEISESLHFGMWCKGKMIYKKYFPDREIATLQYLTSFNSLVKILSYLHEKFIGSVADNKTENDLLYEIVEQDEKLCDNKKIYIFNRTVVSRIFQAECETIFIFLVSDGFYVAVSFARITQTNRFVFFIIIKIHKIQYKLGVLDRLGSHSVSPCVYQAPPITR